jgi:hypothetical protein
VAVLQVATWLGAAFYETSFRPVPLRHFVKAINGDLREARAGNTGAGEPPISVTTVRHIELPLSLPGVNWDATRDADNRHVAALARETAVEGGKSCLIFCASRTECDRMARDIVACIGTIPEKQQQDKAVGVAASIASGANPTTGAAGSAAGTDASLSGLSTPGGVGAGAASPIPPVTDAPPSVLPAGLPKGSRAALVAELRAMNASDALVKSVEHGVGFHHRGADAAVVLLVICFCRACLSLQRLD